MEINENSNLMYLDLLKHCLLNTIYCDYEYSDFIPKKSKGKIKKIKRFLFKKLIVPLIKKSNLRIVTGYPYNEDERISGKDWSPMAHTMIGRKRLDNIQYCVEEVIKNNIPGDLIETGVWRGGATIFMRAILKVYGVTDRIVWVADSFEGLPKPEEEKYPQDKGDRHYTYKQLAVPLEQVKQNFQKYGLLDEQVHFLKGWFKDTLPNAPIEKISVARLDGDLYQSTMDALNNLYHKISVGGFLIVDDYSLKGTEAAVHDFREKHAIKEKIIPIDWTGVYWQKIY